MQINQQETVGLRRRMADFRRAISCELGELAQTVHSWTDWHGRVARHSWSVLGIAALAGYLVVPKRRSSVPVSSADTSLPLGGKAASPGSLVFNALTSFATRAAIGYLQRRWAETRVQDQATSQQPF